jgi:diguanylate cyclase (GGDEF)-like protein
MAGMTDYTGVSMDVILAHIRDWRDETAKCVGTLCRLQEEVRRHREQLDQPDEIAAYVRFFIDLLERYLGDFDRLLTEMPRFVTDAHVEIVQQTYRSASHEEQNCVRFSRDHIDRRLKKEELRWLVDDIYQESRSMLIDYHDLSNLVPRLRTFVGTMPKVDRELEQKFGILFSAAQERRDFEFWTTEAGAAEGYSIGVVFLDIDDFKRLNTAFTESIVDQAILPDFQRLVRDVSLHRGAAYRHGGEEFLFMLPNCGVAETVAFAEKLRARIEARKFSIEGRQPVGLTVSAGVAAWPVHGKTLDEIILEANKAEHAAKAAGKNRVCVAAGT